MTAPTKPIDPIIHIAEQDATLPIAGHANKSVPVAPLTEVGFDLTNNFNCENGNYIFDNFAKWMKYFDLAIDAGGGDVSALEARVAKNEQDISANATDIATNLRNITLNNTQIKAEITNRENAITAEATTRAARDTAIEAKADKAQMDATSAIQYAWSNNGLITKLEGNGKTGYLRVEGNGYYWGHNSATRPIYTDSRSVGIGENALQNEAQKISWNTAVGFSSGVYTNGVGNSYYGTGSGLRVKSGDYNFYGGFDARGTETGSYNVFVGYKSNYIGETNSYCVGIGSEVLRNLTEGKELTALGARALYNCKEGEGSTAVGTEAFYFLEDSGTDALPVWNVALGRQAGKYLQDGSPMKTSAKSFSPSGVICIGADSRVSGGKQMQLGKDGITVYAASSITVRSDERDKADIRNTVLGKEFIRKLRPVDFKYDMRDGYLEEVPDKEGLVQKERDGSNKGKRFHHGFIAQDVESLIEEGEIEDFGGFKDSKKNGGCDVLSLAHDEFIAPIVKALQESFDENDALREENKALKDRMDALEKKMEELLAAK